MTALFDEPPRVTLNPNSPWALGRTGLLLGFYDGGPGHGPEGIICHEGGQVNTMPLPDFTIDFRYDVERDRFVDTNMPRPDQELVEPDQEG